MMVSCAPSNITPPLVSRPDWKTLIRLASTRSKLQDLDACPTPSHPPVGFMAQPINRSLLGFEAQTKKISRWFWGPNHQIVAADFETQTRKPLTTLVLRLNQETVATGLEVKPEKPSQWFWGQITDKPSTLVLRLNQETCAPCLHMHDADRTRRHSTSRSPDHRVPDLCDHPRSFAPGLLLLPQSSSLHVMLHLPPEHHETSKRDSPMNQRIKVKQSNHPEFEFKPRQVNDSSPSNQWTDHLVSHS
jgi:hypothetical protein